MTGRVPRHKFSNVVLASAAAILAMLPVLAAALLAGSAQAQEAPLRSRFVDPEDGWFDVTAFLDTAYGFLPVVVPITDPAVGYGAVGALAFIDRDPQAAAQVRPNIGVAGGLATENGSRGWFAGHLGTWREGRLRTLAAYADMDVNLEFFGFGDEPALDDQALDYEISARGALIGGNYRIGGSPFWAGLRYARADSRVDFDPLDAPPPGVVPGDHDLRLAALTPSLTLDMRNNFFTPTRGWYADLSVPLFRDELGGDRDFEKVSLTLMHYRPLAERWFLSARAGARDSSDGTPFYLRPFVTLRGAQSLRYQGEQAAELEAELRWQFHPRFSLVGFGGAGVARSDFEQQQRRESVTTGGAGFRYLAARGHGLHMGVDVAFGPDEPIFYVVVGSAWLRP